MAANERGLIAASTTRTETGLGRVVEGLRRKREERRVLTENERLRQRLVVAARAIRSIVDSVEFRGYTVEQLRESPNFMGRGSFTANDTLLYNGPGEHNYFIRVDERDNQGRATRVFIATVPKGHKDPTDIVHPNMGVMSLTIGEPDSWDELAVKDGLKVNAVIVGDVYLGQRQMVDYSDDPVFAAFGHYTLDEGQISGVAISNSSMQVRFSAVGFDPSLNVGTTVHVYGTSTQGRGSHKRINVVGPLGPVQRISMSGLERWVERADYQGIPMHASSTDVDLEEGSFAHGQVHETRFGAYAVGVQQVENKVRITITGKSHPVISSAIPRDEVEAPKPFVKTGTVEFNRDQMDANVVAGLLEMTARNMQAAFSRGRLRYPANRE